MMRYVKCFSTGWYAVKGLHGKEGGESSTFPQVTALLSMQQPMAAFCLYPAIEVTSTVCSSMTKVLVCLDTCCQANAYIQKAESLTPVVTTTVILKTGCNENTSRYFFRRNAHYVIRQFGGLCCRGGLAPNLGRLHIRHKRGPEIQIKFNRILSFIEHLFAGPPDAGLNRGGGGKTNKKGMNLFFLKR